MPEYKEFLDLLEIDKISYSTAWRWLKIFSYNYSCNNRSYYTDGHERPDVVKDRDERFLNEYFSAEIIRTHRWVQISERELRNDEELNTEVHKNATYKYTADDHIYYEFHIDAHEKLSACNKAENLKYGQKMGVRKKDGDRPLMIVGQDESTYNQLAFSSRY